MNAQAGPLWTAEQLRWMAALELKPWMHGALPLAVASAQDASDPKPLRLPPAVRQFQSATAARAQPMQRPVPHEDAPADGERSAPRRMAAPGMPDKLHFALIRASGLNPNMAQSQAIFATWPASTQLRADPQAKRALWPTLRKLRKAARHNG